MTRAGCFSLIVVFLAAAGGAAEKPGIHLAPGRQVTFTWLRQDDHAYRWDIIGNGVVADGSHDAYDGGMRLKVNGTDFPSLDTARGNQDNTEIEIGPWRTGQLRVWRRIFINRKMGYCRWIDIFENTGAAEVDVAVQYHSNMGQSTRDTYTSSGKAALTDKDWGVVTGRGPRDTNYPAIVHVFGSPGAKFKPSFQYTRNTDDLYYRAGFKVPAKKPVALCLIEAQRKPFQQAVEFLKNFSPRRELRLLPGPLRRILLNMRGALLTVEGIELNRNEETDVVVLRNGDEILGRITNPRFVLETEFGQLTLPAERVVGLLCPAGRNERVQMVLTDGQVVAGRLTGDPVGVRLAGGTELKIPVKGLAQASYRLSPEKPEEVKAAGALVMLRSGARLAFDETGRTFPFLTAHGPVKLAAADLRAIELDTAAGGLHRAVFRNGSVLAGLLPDERVQLQLELSLALDVARQRVRRFLFANEPVDAKPLASLMLRNEDVLHGRFADTSWKVHTEFGVVTVSPPTLAQATFSKDSPGRAKLVLRDGTKIGGRLAQDYVRFRMQPGPELKIHVSHIDSTAGAGEALKPAAPPGPGPTTAPTTTPTATRRWRWGAYPPPRPVRTVRAVHAERWVRPRP